MMSLFHIMTKILLLTCCCFGLLVYAFFYLTTYPFKGGEHEYKN